MKIVLILLMVLFAGCDEEGNTGSVRLYGRGLYGCGDTISNAGYYYKDDFGQRVAIGGMSLPCLKQPLGLVYDPYGGEFPYDYCNRVDLHFTGITDADGIMRIRGMSPSDCSGHPTNWPHKVAARFAMATNVKKTADASYWCNLYPPGPSQFMWPNGSCPILHIKHINLPKATEEANMALEAPTSGGASQQAMMDSGWDAEVITTAMIDPNAVVLPPYGIEYDVNLVRQYNTYAERIDQVVASDSNDWLVNYEGQYPCKYEYIVACAYPVDIEDMASTARVRSSIGEVDVKLEVLAGNDDQTVWVLESEYFLPLSISAYTDLMNDPNEHVIYDRWSDPNEGPVGDVPLHYLPLEDNDEITVEFTGTIDLFQWWLSGNPSADFNGDGICNYEDWLYLLF